MTSYTSRAYALVNREDKRHEKEVVEYLDPQSDDHILEIGCGRGFITKKIQKVASHTYGVDVNPESIANGVTDQLRQMSAEDLEFPDESFDKVYSFHTIEHIPHPKKMLREVARVLKPGGKALIVYPAEPIRGLFSIPAALVMFKNPFRTREIHLHKLNPQKVQELAEENGLQHVRSKFSWLSFPQYFTVFKKYNGD